MGKERSGGVHAGHRGRMRRRFLEQGLGGLADHEVLELLLYYAIPRRDVNGLAHNLIDRFGSLPGVLDAPEEELQTIPGVGPKVAGFLNLIPELLVQMARQSLPEAAVFLRGPQDANELVAARCPELAVGEILLALTDGIFRVLNVHRYESFEQLNVRVLASRSAAACANHIILVERMEDSWAIPSSARLQAIEELDRQMKAVGFPLWDYYTVDDHGGKPRSFARTGMLLPRMF